MTSQFPLHELNIYPVKSCQGQSVKEMVVTSEGPEGDRQWMIIDEQGTFLSQRTVPKLATVQVLLNESGLSLGLGKQFFVVPQNNSFRRLVRVTVGHEEFEAALEPDLFSQAFSQYLGLPCRLVRLRHPSSPEPLRILNTKSLEDLNSEQVKSADPEQFCGHLVYRGEKAFEEWAWSRIRIGDVVFSQSHRNLWVPESPGKVSLSSKLEVLEQDNAPHL